MPLLTLILAMLGLRMESTLVTHYYDEATNALTDIPDYHQIEIIGTDNAIVTTFLIGA